MRNGSCKSQYPKNFNEHTTHVDDGYHHYRRRRSGLSVKVRNYYLDNRWVAPYNPYLLAMFDCHLNVEIFSTIKLVKYLYTYIYKGHDRVSFHITSEDSREDIDEINQFQSEKWIAAVEAVWRIFKFKMNEMTPSIYTLQLHLPGQQIVSFHKNTSLSSLVDNIDFSKTMLTEFFHMNLKNKKLKI
ncbi:hypothetical protein ACH5RR_006039 [Cinchona calisaya]|uniref:Uncharacterized protein n=1 Tax=Cinchona calisaya TaxID=153742 RepID=A0ABD3AN76_9GENT